MPDRQVRGAAPGVSALYLHLPFCVRKCAYCDFASLATAASDPLMSSYVEALARQLGELEATGLIERCATAYVGGGTPSHVGAESLGRLVTRLRRVAPALTELSCEANPESLDGALLEVLVAAGVTRLSIGVQSLVDEELRELGRAHDAARAVACVMAAVASGVDVSADLMCAKPLETPESWRHSLETLVGLGVGHVSVYPLQIEEGTPLAQRLGGEEPAWNDPDVQAERMEAAAELLVAHGFARYEVASYARPGRECRHNEAYWSGRSYLGLGEAAASMLDRAAYGQLRVVCPQLPALGPDVSRVRLSVARTADEIARRPGLAELDFELELLDEAQAVAEDLMLAMRMTRGADAALLARARAVLDASAFVRAIEGVLARGLAAWGDDRLVPTRAGWLRGNELYGALWDLAPGEVRRASTR